MRKLFTGGFGLYTGFLLLVALIICGSASAKAAETVDLGVIEFGKKYDLPQFQDIIGTIVIPADAPTNKKGKVTLKQERGNELYLYSDQAHTKEFRITVALMTETVFSAHIMNLRKARPIILQEIS